MPLPIATIRVVAAHVESETDVEYALAAEVDILAHIPRWHLSDDTIAKLIDREISINPTLAIRHGYTPQAGGVLMDNLVRFYRAGGTLLLGDDSLGVGLLQLELQLMMQSGMTVPELVATATGNTAAALGLTDVGIISPGNRADLLIVSADVLQDAQMLLKPRVVILNGQVVVDQ